MSSRFPALALICVALVSNVAAETIEGFAEPYKNVELAFGDAGIIARIDVVEGDHVQKGQPLIALDSTVLKATLAIAKKKASSSSAFDEARAELNLHNERLSQILLLRQRGHATQRELSRSQTDAAVAEARMRRAKDEISLSQLEYKRIEAQISQRRIDSPFAGIVTKIHRSEGEPTLVTDPRIVTLAQLDKLRVKFPATPTQAANLKKDQRVSLELADGGGSVPAIIERLGATVDAKSGTLEVHVVIDNADGAVRSGLRCLLDVDADHSNADRNSVAKATR